MKDGDEGVLAVLYLRNLATAYALPSMLLVLIIAFQFMEVVGLSMKGTSLFLVVGALVGGLLSFAMAWLHVYVRCRWLLRR